MLKLNKLFGLTSAAFLAMTLAGSASPIRTAALSRTAARDFGPVNAGARIKVTVHLKLPDQALFRKTVDALYDRTSSTFHHWLTDAQLRTFAPPAAQLAAVRAELQSNGLTVVSIDRDGFSVQAQGTIAAISRAFHTELHQYSLNGKAFRANTRPPTLSGPAGSAVANVSGLESHTVQPMLARAVNMKTKTPLAAVSLKKVLATGGLASLISDKIVGPKQTFNYTTSGGLPKATYTGLAYHPDATKTPDYTPKQLQDMYGMTAAYQTGLTGAGQTIVLLEAYGYSNMLADANAFSKLTGLPLLDATNFAAVYPEGTPNPNAGQLTGWSTEIALDIQWAHALAPGAKILVVATNGQDTQDFEASMQYIIDNHLGNAVSDSWEEDVDLLAGPAEQEGFEDVLVAAAAKGISFQFSTGDSGDNGIGSPLGAAGVPSVAPHATAVGGTAIGNDPGTSRFVPVGWGDTFDIVDGGGVLDPPTSFFFAGGGSGGGQSLFWPKPAWQVSLPGFNRQTPDVSALADPYTGVPIVVFDPILNQQVVLVGIGGTSLASPIFTAIWAIANERAGHPLGQASPTIAALKSGIMDVLPVTSSAFSASVTDAKGTKKYSANDLFAYLQTFGYSKQNILATVWDQPQYSQAFVFAFGYDTSLTVTPGWDNVTGYGTPYGLDFINAAASY